MKTGKAPISARDRLIVALDVPVLEEAVSLIDELSPIVNTFKVGIAPHTSFGDELLAKIAHLNKNVFLDLKFHDIPNTVKNAAKAAATKGIFMLNFHCLGGARMLKAAVAGVKEVADHEPIMLGVTILTSMQEQDLHSVGIKSDVTTAVLQLVEIAHKAGLDGVVASAKEAKAIKQAFGDDFIVVTPGIRPATNMNNHGDQRRVLTPSQAVIEGADYIVVGRPILQAKNPLLAAEKIIEELEDEVDGPF